MLPFVDFLQLQYVVTAATEEQTFLDSNVNRLLVHPHDYRYSSNFGVESDQG